METKHSTKPGQNRWGSLYVIASVMGSAVASGWISPEVAGGQWKAMVVYITGLMTQTNITATNLAQEIGEVSHDAISRMLAGASWSLTVGICLAIRVIEQIGGEGWLIVDDVLIPKVFGREIAFCGWDHDHTHNRTVFGQRLVFVVWSNGWLTIPVAFAFWQQDPNRKPKPKKKGGKRGWPKGKKRGPRPTPTNSKRRQPRWRLPNGIHYRTKNELARILVWKVLRCQLRVDWILFDNWYLSDDNLKHFARLGLKWVSKAKSNLMVTYGGQDLSVEAVAATVGLGNYHYYPKLGGRVRSFLVSRHGLELRLTVIKKGHGSKLTTHYLLSNDLTLTNQHQINWYRRRWSIETFFRDTKQLLGLGRCQSRLPNAIVTHVALVCVAYACLQLLKPRSLHHRPSIVGSHQLLASLQVVWFQHQPQLVRVQSSAQISLVDPSPFWDAVRTRLSALPLPESPDFSKVYVPSSKAA